MTSNFFLASQLTCLSLLLSLGAFAQNFQQVSCEGPQCQKVLIASPESNFTFVPPPAGFEQGGLRDVVISVTYNGFTPGALNAFQYAVDIWASVLTSTVPIEIDAYWEDIPGSVLGYAGASTYYSSIGGGPDPDAYYPVALANKIFGSDLYSGPDVDAHFDSSTNWYFGTDGNPGFGQYDFVSVVLHELGHGLGVIGSGDVDAGQGYLGLGDDFTIWDTFVVNGNGTDITTYFSPSTTLATQFQSNNLFWSGAAAVANNGGIQPKLYAPSTWESGSSFSHLDEATYFSGSVNSLMTPQIGAAEAIHDPGPIVIGIMNDIGWDVQDVACEPIGLELYQEACTADETTLYPTIGMFFDIDGACTVADFCFQVGGGGFTCFDLPSLDIIVGDGDQLFFNNTDPDVTYEFYYTLSNGAVSDIFIWENGNCDNEEQICDCDGNQLSIGVLAWLGDGFLDDGTYLWAGQTVNFNCATWGYDCGDGGVNNDPNGVCDGNLPPNNGCTGEILGCTDPEATNYNPTATINDGSCVYDGDIPGCTDAAACNYNPDATIDNGSCNYSCYGCTNPEACNYNPNATIDNGSCSFSCYGCTDTLACNYNPNATIDNGSCTYGCYGCTDPNALNYDPDATLDDGSCEYLGVPGCMDLDACNFNPEATIDNGTCDYSCLGCTDQLACNFDSDATIDDGSCDYTCYGCTDLEACNYDADATFDDGSCDYSCYGCTDDGACNFDVNATIDDGSCEFDSCLGCTDATAVNFDPTALIDDGSCVYECVYPTITWEFEGCDGGDDGFFVVMLVSNLGNGAPYIVGNNQNTDEITLNFNGSIQLGPFDDGDQVVIDITSEELTNCFLTSPVLECPDGVLEGLLREEIAFPTPAHHQFYIQAGSSALNSNAALFDATGKMVWSERILIAAGDSRTVDVQSFSPGMYELIIWDEFGKSNHRLIIE